MTCRRKLIAIGCLALMLGGCAGGRSLPVGGSSGGGYYQNDGPPDDENIDIAAIADAVPVNEPPSKYGNPDSYDALGNTYYVLDSAAGFTQTGRASWYGRQFHGRRTSSGEPYNMFKMTAAHKRLPIPSYVRVTHLETGKHVIVRVNDRGPFHDGRIIDLSYVAARRLGVVAHGSAPVRIETVTPESLRAERARGDRPEDSAGEGNRPSGIHTGTRRSAASGAPEPATGPARPPQKAPLQTPAGAGGPRAIPVANRTVAASARGDLYLQNGAFGDPDNARQLRARLRQAGFKQIVVDEPDTATGLYRVLIGPFDSDSDRTEIRQVLDRRGFAASNVQR